MPAVTVYFNGPMPPSGRAWCTICAMVYKKAGVDRLASSIKMMEQGNHGPAPRLDLVPPPTTEQPELQIAVTRGLFAGAPNLGILDLCWSHLAGLDLVGAGLLAASPQDAAFFGQAQMLGQRPQG